MRSIVEKTLRVRSDASPLASNAAPFAPSDSADPSPCLDRPGGGLAHPNYALAYNVLGGIRSYSGEPLEAIPLLERAMRLDPAHAEQYLHFLGMAYLLAGKYETAVTLFRERIVLVPRTDFSRAPLASALGHLGEVDEARRIWRELMEINPKYSFSEHFGRLPFQRQEDVQRIVDGLAKAGLSTKQADEFQKQPIP